MYVPSSSPLVLIGVYMLYHSSVCLQRSINPRGLSSPTHQTAELSLFENFCMGPGRPRVFLKLRSSLHSFWDQFDEDPMLKLQFWYSHPSSACVTMLSFDATWCWYYNLLHWSFRLFYCCLWLKSMWLFMSDTSWCKYSQGLTRPHTS